MLLEFVLYSKCAMFEVIMHQAIFRFFTCYGVRELCIRHVHISSKGSHLLTGGFLVYGTYMVSQIGYGQTKLEETMYSKYTAQISSNGSHFLTPGFLLYWTYKVSKIGYGCTIVVILCVFCLGMLGFLLVLVCFCMLCSLSGHTN